MTRQSAPSVVATILHSLKPWDLKAQATPALHPAEEEKETLGRGEETMKDASNIIDKFQEQGMMQKEKQRSKVGQGSRLNLSQTISISNLHFSYKRQCFFS